MKRKGIRGRQRVLVELKAQLREAGGQFAVYLLVSVGKGRAAAGEPLVGLFEQSPLFGVQPQRLPPIVNRLDPGEQLRIEAYVVAELGQQGESSSARACIVSFVCASFRLRKILEMRSRRRPLNSSASIVLANVGAWALPTIAAMSARASRTACSKAGL